MTLQLTSYDGAADVTTVVVVGEVDVSTVSRVRTTIDDLVVDGHVHLVLDLNGVTFMDSLGLGVLVAAHRKVRVFHGSLALVADRGPVPKLLALTALDRVLRHFSTLDEAMAARS